VIADTALRWVAPAIPVAVALGFAASALLSGGDAAAAPADPALVATGAEIFAVQCSSCHGVDGAGVDGRGPSLEHEGTAATDFVLRTGRMPLANPHAQARRGPVRFDEEQITALVAFVDSIGDGPATPTLDLDSADLTRGGELYLLNCAACHVASGAGAPIGSGKIAPNLLSSTPTQVGQAIVVGPGAMPVFDTLSESDMSDIARYVEHLKEQDTTSPWRFGGAGPVAEGLAAFILGVIPLIAVSRWLGRPSEGRDVALVDGDPGEGGGDDG